MLKHRDECEANIPFTPSPLQTSDAASFGDLTSLEKKISQKVAEPNSGNYFFGIGEESTFAKRQGPAMSFGPFPHPAALTLLTADQFAVLFSYSHTVTIRNLRLMAQDRNAKNRRFSLFVTASIAAGCSGSKCTGQSLSHDSECTAATHSLIRKIFM